MPRRIGHPLIKSVTSSQHKTTEVRSTEYERGYASGRAGDSLDFNSSSVQFVEGWSDGQKAAAK